ncbi:MAG: 3-phosphoshikimate 1-carboxyvinyltransferase, partial [Deltaproteobacteria bacterium]|nr:3-phosphoshikimate 1-carboxyvinyltransferase [Deltaproteobacteria bacterium]
MTSQLDAPASKSMTQRALVIAALGGEPTRIDGPLICDDSLVLIEALRAFGCEIDVGETLVDVRPGPLTTPKGTLCL